MSNRNCKGYFKVTSSNETHRFLEDLLSLLLVFQKHKQYYEHSTPKGYTVNGFFFLNVSAQNACFKRNGGIENDKLIMLLRH